MEWRSQVPQKVRSPQTQAGHGEPRRLLADFVVGAPALLRANQFFTLDKRLYRRDFAELLLNP
jgi:hypothetical protein